MSIIQGAILGLVQGLGEFLPISSSGHVLLASMLMGVEFNDTYKILVILLHVGTLIPALIVFWNDWIDMILHPIRNKTLLLLVVASLPTLAVYILAKKLFPEVNGFSVFDNGWFLGAAFLITALFLLLCDGLASRRRSAKGEKVSFLNAVVMGLFQGIGMTPGISRSGSTIFGGVVYYIVITLVLNLGMKANDLKLFTAIVVGLFLGIPYWKGQLTQKFSRKTYSEKEEVIENA